MSGELKVFLVPVGHSRHLPYCEPGESQEVPPHEGSGVGARLVRQFREVLHVAEQSRLAHDGPPRVAHGWVGRLRLWALGWLADRIAEQRLLWQLRGRHEATLFYPVDLAEAEARRLVLNELRHDGDRHRRWLVIDATLLALSSLLVIVPGPNVIAYYFAFRVVGHFLSLRGARQGLSRVSWTLQPSTELGDLREALRLEAAMRHERVRDIAAQLELPHLVRFVERVAFRGA